MARSKNQLQVRAMGKTLIIDNPTKINLVFKERGQRCYRFDLKIDKHAAKRLEKTYNRLSRGVIA